MDNRRIAEKYVEEVGTGSPDKLGAFLHPDFEVHYPQSGERIHGKDNYIAMLSNFPGGLARADIDTLSGANQDVTVVRPAPFSMPQITLAGSGDTIIAEGTATYPNGDVYHVAWVMHFEAGKIRRENWYFGAPFEPPEWREPYRD